MKRSLENNKGITILELLVVVAIIGILVMIGLPNIPPIIAGHRLRTSANDLLSKLRTVRTLAITKNRRLKLEMDTNAQSFTVTKLEHVEYNLVGTVNDQDFNTTLLTGTSDDLAGFVLFTENEEQIHLNYVWDSNGDPVYDVPINYNLETGMGGNGVENMTMTPSTVMYFNPDGTIDKTVTIKLIGPERYGPGIFTIVTYKGGQIKIL